MILLTHPIIAINYRTRVEQMLTKIENDSHIYPLKLLKVPFRHPSATLPLPFRQPLGVVDFSSFWLEIALPYRLFVRRLWLVAMCKRIKTSKQEYDGQQFR